MTDSRQLDVRQDGLGIGHWAFIGHCVIGHWSFHSVIGHFIFVTKPVGKGAMAGEGLLSPVGCLMGWPGSLPSAPRTWREMPRIAQTVTRAKKRPKTKCRT